MRAIVTVLGKDRVGIMSLVCALLAQHNVNILDISQTILQGDFTMVMLVDAGACDIPFAELAALGCRPLQRDVFGSCNVGAGLVPARRNRPRFS